MHDEKESKTKNNKKMKTCRIHVPNGQEYRCEIPKNALGQVLITQFFDLLDIIETDYFGLYFHDFSSYNWWLEPNKSVKHQMKSDLWEFYFGVKFYPPHPAQLHEDCTRYYMVLQLRNDIFAGRLPCTFATHALLGSYVVQSELGDFDQSMLESKHYSEFRFAPNQSIELEDRVRELHELHKGQRPEQAELNYLENVKKLPLYGIDLHHSRDSDSVDLNIGIGFNGINIYRDGSVDQRFPWTQVIKLSYICSKFYITYRPKGDRDFSKVGFKMANHRSAKKVWKSGVEHHSFFRLSRSEMKTKNKFVRVGSTFRYSGRTQCEAREALLHDENLQKRRQPTILRAQSRRLRSDGESTVSPRSVQRYVQEEHVQQVEEEEQAAEKPPPLPAKRLKRPITSSSSSPLHEEDAAEIHHVVVEHGDYDVTNGADDDVTDGIRGEHKLLMAANSLSTISSDESGKNEHHITSHRPYYDDDDEDELIENGVHLSLHQKQIQKMKIEFLAALPPTSMYTESQCSLEALDARLPPRKISITKIIHHRSSSSASGSAASEGRREEVEDEKEEEREETRENSPASLEVEVEDDDEHMKTATTDEDDNECHEEAAVATMTSSSSSVEVEVASSDVSVNEQQQPHHENHDDVTIESTSAADTSAVSSSTTSSDEERRLKVEEIPTVETKTVEIEEITIPRGENEIRRVSLRSMDDGYLVHDAPAESAEPMEMMPVDNNDASNCVNHINTTNMESPSKSAPFIPNDPSCQAPTVQTQSVLILSTRNEENDDDNIVGSYVAPVVATETTTITYECADEHKSHHHQEENSSSSSPTPQLVTSQVISRESDNSVTTTEITKYVHEGVNQLVFDRQVVTTGGAVTPTDHHKVLAEAVHDVSETLAPQMNITKVVLEEETTTTTTN